MRTKVFLKTVALSAVILFSAMAASAAYMKYSYKYDDQKRMTESETMKWNSQKNTWENDLRICYAYQGKSITTTYYKWNSKQKAYVLVPDMTVTMDNPSL